MEEYMKKYEEWLNNPFFDKATKEELNSIKDKEDEIEDRFYPSYALHSRLRAVT